MGVGDTNVWKGAVEDTVALVVGISVVWAVCLKIPLCCLRETGALCDFDKI